MRRAGIATGGAGIDASTLLQTRDPIGYYASAEGGRVAFNLTTYLVPVAAGSDEQNLAALVNPAGSGMDMHIDLGEFGSSADTTFRRYRNSTLSGLANEITGSNTGGGTAVSVGRMYKGADFVRTGGIASKTAFIRAYETYFTYIKGRSILRPGQSLAWTIQQSSGGAGTASVYIEYWELPAVA